MKNKIKFIFLSLMVGLLSFFGFAKVKADSLLANKVDVILEQQENLNQDKIRYISTLSVDGISLDDITSIDVSISLKKAGEETKNTSTTLTKVFDSVSGTNGKEKKDNTYYAVLTVTDLASNYPLWTLETTFEYVFSDSSTKETNTISYVIPMPQSYTHVAEKDPTCNEAGNYEYYHDEANNTYYDKNGNVTSLENLTIPKTGLHTWVQSGLTNPTRVADGSVTYTCSICNEEKTLTIDKLGLTRVYFTNSNYWTTVYAYIFNSENDTYNTWPGTQMTWLKNNDYGQGIYYIDFNISSYNYIIFTDGTSQTVNITVDKTTTNAYYPSDANLEGKYTVGTWSFFDIPDSSLDNHNWDSGVISKAPSCTEVGYKTYTCTDLGCDETKVELLAPLGHTWNSGEVTKEPTESTKGIKTYTCTVCGETKTEDIPVLAHTHQEGTPIYTWSNDHLSCSATLPCSICGEALAYESVKATYEDTVIATCQTNGTRVFTSKSFLNNAFSVQTYNESTTGDHQLVITDNITTAATCTTSGISTHEVTCSICNQVLASEDMVIDPTGHNYDSGIVIAPTRLTAGSVTYTCQNCNEEKQTTIPALGQNGVYFTNNKGWDQVYIYPFTASDVALYSWPGTAMTYIGQNGDNQGIYYLEFDITTYTKVVFNNTNGLQSVDVTLDLTTTNAYYLSSDESKYTVGTWTYYSIPNGLCTEHEWDDGVITTPATTTSTGVLTYTCTVCGETYTEVIPKLGHTHDFEYAYSYSTKYHFHNCIDPDCDLVSDKEEHNFLLYYDNGVYYNFCTVCGYVEESTIAGLKLHYYRPDNDYSVINYLWLWGDNIGANLYQMTETDSFGHLYTLPYSAFAGNDSFGLIIKCEGADNWSSQDGSNKYFSLSDLKKDSNNYYHAYFTAGSDQTYKSVSESRAGNINYFKVYYEEGSYYLTYGLATAAISWSITVNGNPLVSSGTTGDDNNVKGYSTTYLKYKLGTTIPNLSDIYTLTVIYSDGKGSRNASMWDLYNLAAFDQTYGFDGALGAIYSKTETIFKVWSPLATSMKLRIYETGTPKSLGGSDSYTEYQMTGGTKATKGVWSYTLNGDQEGKYYTYVVTNYLYTKSEVVDPYAKSTGVNGLRGMVVDFSKVNPDGWDDISILNTNSMDLVVYEAHIADLTSSETWGGPQNLAKTYLGFCYSGTTYTEGNVTVSTGFDHIKELGVNAVQLLPIFDSSNDEINPSFNWGYNPLNYNSLDGSYSTNPYDGYEKIREFKQLVYEYNKAGITIIMDVVFNHVADAAGSNFTHLMPGYYFRTSNGYYCNASGCGNETASDRLMFHKFMIDSTEFWAREYKLGGFRFDLMGIHDIETMEALADNLKDNVQSNIVVYGEPWAALGDSSTKECCSLGNYYKWEDFGAFNSTIRDAMFGNVSNENTYGWGSVSYADDTDLYKIMNGVMGYMQDDRLNPVENTVAYISCHDNYNVADHLATCSITGQTAARISTLGHAIILTSQGISFIQEGEEFLRTKDGCENSYNKPYEVNDLDYSYKVTYNSMFQNFKKLVALKTSGDITIPLDQISDVRNTIVYDTTNFSYFYYEVGDYVIFHHNGYGQSYINTSKYNGYTVYLDTIGELKDTIGDSITLKSHQTVILKKNN